jgi:hypothetical protein
MPARALALLSRNAMRMVHVVHPCTTEMTQDKRDHCDDDDLDGWTHGIIMPYVSNAVIITPADSSRVRLVDGEVAACATNHIKDGSGVNELEAVAKSIPLPNHRKNDHRSGRKHEVQLQNLAQRHFKRQDRPDPGFADVNGTTLQPATGPRMYRDVDFEFEPGMAAGLDLVPCHRARVLLYPA